jgi:glycosyltransferase involved in cell wall biosynthesis
MLCKCIDSILSLSLNKNEREIIIVDDGSDISPIIELSNYHNEIIYIYQPNGGLSSARNTGIRASTGKYIQFVDGDDFLIKAPYEHCLDIMRYNDPDVVLFYITKDKKGEVSFTYDGPFNGSMYMKSNNLQASACGYIFKREILTNLRFRVGSYHEDEEFTPQLLLRADKVFHTNAKAYYYRTRKESITNKDGIQEIAKRLIDKEDILYNLNNLTKKLNGRDKEAMERRVAQLTMDLLYNIMSQTHSVKHLDQCIKRLSGHGLFPLPDCNYSRKYNYFRKIINNKIMRKMFCKLIAK